MRNAHSIKHVLESASAEITISSQKSFGTAPIINTSHWSFQSPEFQSYRVISPFISNFQTVIELMFNIVSILFH